MLQTLFATAESHPVIGTIAMLGGFAILPVLHFARMLLTRQAATAEVERTTASERAIRDEAVRYRADSPGTDVPVILRPIRAVYHVGGHRYVRDLIVNVVAGDPSPAVVTVWYRPEDPGSPALGTIPYGPANAMVSIVCAVLTWAATMVLIRP